jgi:hypothetical protein
METIKKHDTTARTVPLAMRAVARHLVDYELTIVSIHEPKPGEDAILVYVRGDQAWADWIATIAVDGTTRAPAVQSDLPDGAYEWYVVRGRLPDSGVRVAIKTVRRAVPPVQLVHRLVAVPGGAS